MERDGRSDRISFGEATAYACLALACLLLLDILATPRMTSVRVRSPEGAPHTASLPLSQPGISGALTIDVSMHLSRLQRRTFIVRSNVCGNSAMTTNGVESRFRCNGLTTPQGLRDGKNVLSISLFSPVRQTLTFALTLDESDPWNLLWKLAVGIVLLLWSLKLETRIIGSRLLVRRLFVLGATVALLYTVATPYNIRDHDTSGHLQYLEHLARERELPPPWMGWETHQPPLYYVISAPFTALENFMQFPDRWSLHWIQMLSYALMLGTLLSLTKIARDIAEQTGISRAGSVFLLLSLLFPAMIMMSSRIGNDILVQFLMFLCMSILVSWWRNPKRRLAESIIVVYGLALLTKLNAIILLPIIVGCAVLHAGIGWKQKTIIILTTVLLTAAVTLAPFMRTPPSFITNRMILPGSGQSQRYTLRTSIATFAVFHPVSVLNTPWALPGSDDGGRQYFWMYIFKSALFGDFLYASRIVLWSARVLVVAAFAFGITAVMSFVRILRSRVRRTETLPYVLACVSSAGAAVVYRLVNPPFAPNQDFRFMTLFIIGVAGIVALAAARDRYLLRTATWTSSCFFGGCLLFLLSIVFDESPKLLSHLF